MIATPVLQNRLLAQSGREFDLWQACHEFPEERSKIVPPGAPVSTVVFLQSLPPVPLARIELMRGQIKRCFKCSVTA